MMKRTLETISARNSYEQWLPALETSSREVFRMVLGAELGSCSPQPWKGSEFTAMLGLAGDLCGLLSLRCRQESATLVASSMLDLAPENAAEHACDAIGEVANMVAGNFKNKLSGTARKCLLSVPTVITGADYSITVSALSWIRILSTSGSPTGECRSKSASKFIVKYSALNARRRTAMNPF